MYNLTFVSICFRILLETPKNSLRKVKNLNVQLGIRLMFPVAFPLYVLCFVFKNLCQPRGRLYRKWFVYFSWNSFGSVTKLNRIHNFGQKNIIHSLVTGLKYHARTHPSLSLSLFLTCCQTWSVYIGCFTD